MTTSDKEPESRLNEEQIFLAAARLSDSAARKRFIAQVCGENEELRDRIEVRLASALEVPTEFMDRGAINPIAIKTALPSVSRHFPGTGDRVGPFVLCGEIARGATSVVYRALQSEPLRREVAVKILAPGFLVERFMARIELERQALAVMDHPNVAKIFDTGVTDGGLPFLAMELVDGPPITEYCDRRELGIRERLELFCKVCRGVQHAHQKGIAHRDLKPNNVLVAETDGEATPKVIDFGIAKAMGDSPLAGMGDLTLDGDILGTPEYMSPEQIAADPAKIDARTDVYSLGVLLYELLTGRRPFESSARHNRMNELFNLIQEGGPVAPSMRFGVLDPEDSSVLAQKRGTDSTRLRRTICGDLDWIVLKALEKEPEHRYGTTRTRTGPWSIPPG